MTGPMERVIRFAVRKAKGNRRIASFLKKRVRSLLATRIDVDAMPVLGQVRRLHPTASLLDLIAPTVLVALKKPG